MGSVCLKPINMTNKVLIPNSRRIFNYGSNKMAVEGGQSLDRKHVTTGPNKEIECCISLFNVIDMLTRTKVGSKYDTQMLDPSTTY
ncbi:hypothetical protein J6590_077324 [Homalodisca vitripennis]|nr:hypothetical protein J6590_077324 [Homalodisca vitripennis]